MFKSCLDRHIIKILLRGRLFFFVIVLCGGYVDPVPRRLVNPGAAPPLEAICRPRHPVELIHRWRAFGKIAAGHCLAQTYINRKGVDFRAPLTQLFIGM